MELRGFNFFWFAHTFKVVFEIYGKVTKKIFVLSCPAALLNKGRGKKKSFFILGPMH